MQDIPYGYCHCGCGGKAPIVRSNDRARGYVKGEPHRYIKGHSRAKKPVSLVDYIVDEATGCWVWQRHITNGGYGIAQAGVGKQDRAHRVYYERYKGPIPEGLHIDHLCFNPPCVNPDHLEAVTPTENSRRGRWVRLTHSGVFMLRMAYATTTLSYRELGEMFGMSKSAAHAAATGVTWDGRP